jgi:hypothetical protein
MLYAEKYSVNRGWGSSVSVIAVAGQLFVIQAEISHFLFRQSHKFSPKSFELNKTRLQEKIRLILTLSTLLVAIIDLILYTKPYSFFGYISSMAHLIGFLHFPRDGTSHMTYPWHKKGNWGLHEDFHVCIVLGDIALVVAYYCAFSAPEAAAAAAVVL